MTANVVSPIPDLAALKIEDRARDKHGGSWLRWSAALLAAALLAGGVLFAVRARVPFVDVETVRGLLTDSEAALLNASGHVTARRRATVSAKITGLVTRIFFEEGMRVKEGQILATLDASDARVRLMSAKADRDAAAAALGELRVSLANAERELDRNEQLQKEGLTSLRALDNARTTVESLRARIDLANNQVSAAEARVGIARQDEDDTIIRAPFSGLVVSKDSQVGEIISPVSAGGGYTRAGIATLVDTSSLEIEVDVNEANLSKVRVGQSVKAVLDAYPNKQLSGRVHRIIPSAEREKATVKVRIAVDSLESEMLPDMAVKVAFLAESAAPGTDHANAVVIPRQAIRQEGDEEVVYLYAGGRIERRVIRLGTVHGDDQEVVAGLIAGDQIVVGSFRNLQDGSRVRIRIGSLR
jgi:RND family efflux transporter MFP subunit